MRPKLIEWLHSKFAQMLEFIDGFQLVPVGLHVVRLLQSLRLMNLVIAGWLIRIWLVLRIVVLGIGAFVVGVFFGVGHSLSRWSGRLHLRGVRLSDP